MAEAKQVEEEELYDVVVVGSGAAGLTAAYVCANEGLRTLLCEKTPFVGGTTATSGGVAWIPNNHLSGEGNPADRGSSAWRLVAERAKTLLREDLLECFLNRGPEAIRYLEEHSELRFEVANIPDYYDIAGFAEVRSALAPMPFDGRRLGEDFELVRAPYAQFLVLGGLMVGRRDIHALLKPYASWRAFRRFCSILLRHARDRLSYTRGTHLLMGNALVASLLFSARQAGVAIRVNTRLVTLEAESGAVRKAIFESNGQAFQVRARHGIVLACGGFPHNRPLRDARMRGFEHEHSLALTANTGDAHLAACGIGAAVDSDMRSPGFWTACTVFNGRDGKEILYPYGHLDRGKPGLVIVDATGRRIVNESDSYHDVAIAMFEQRRAGYTGRFFQVFDSRFLWEYGLGFIRPMTISLRKFISARYLIRASTVTALAQTIHVDPGALVETIQRHNEGCPRGVDIEFGKGASTFNRYNGDPRVSPNPCLAPIAKPPFFAVPIEPASLGCSAGIRVGPDSNVLNVRGEAIRGLYACGNEMGSAVRGEYVGAGITIGPAIVFGYLAARHIARQANAGALREPGVT